MSLLQNPVRLLLKALAEDCTPKQLAFGVALGMVLGLLPKGNLLAIACMAVFCAARINLGVGTLAALVFSGLAVFLDPLTHVIGMSVLTAEWLRPAWTMLYNLPVAPWTRFNNTIVLGNLLVGLVLFYPTYRVGVVVFTRISPRIAEVINRSSIARWLWKKPGSILDNTPSASTETTTPTAAATAAATVTATATAAATTAAATVQLANDVVDGGVIDPTATDSVQESTEPSPIDERQKVAA